MKTSSLEKAELPYGWIMVPKTPHGEVTHSHALDYPLKFGSFLVTATNIIIVNIQTAFNLYNSPLK